MDSRWNRRTITAIRKRHALRSLGAGLVFFAALYIFNRFFSVSVCLVKNIFGVNCPGCGLTRGFISVLRLDFKSAFSYHVLAVPLFFGIFLYCFFCIVDVAFHKAYVVKIEKQMAKWYMYIVYSIILIVAGILNSLS